MTEYGEMGENKNIFIFLFCKIWKHEKIVVTLHCKISVALQGSRRGPENLQDARQNFFCGSVILQDHQNKT